MGCVLCVALNLHHFFPLYCRPPHSCSVLEGYGQTECTAAATLSAITDVKTFGHVGGPLPCNEIKLVSVEDMGYRYDDKFHGRVADDVRTPASCTGWVVYRAPSPVRLGTSPRVCPSLRLVPVFSPTYLCLPCASPPPLPPPPPRPAPTPCFWFAACLSVSSARQRDCEG